MRMPIQPGGETSPQPNNPNRLIDDRLRIIDATARRHREVIALSRRIAKLKNDFGLPNTENYVVEGPPNDKVPVRHHREVWGPRTGEIIEGIKEMRIRYPLVDAETAPRIGAETGDTEEAVAPYDRFFEFKTTDGHYWRFLLNSGGLNRYNDAHDIEKNPDLDLTRDLFYVTNSPEDPAGPYASLSRGVEQARVLELIDELLAVYTPLQQRAAA